MPADLLAGLNPEQRSAVTLPSGSALILAGAGSGKTRVLTTRIAWLLSHGLASPSSILAVTFTNKAAKEMQARLSASVPISPRQMWMGTFHGLCHRFLRIHARDVGLPESFQILDMQDQLAAIKRLLKTLKLTDDRYPPRQVQQFINRHKDAGTRAEQLSGMTPFDRQMIAVFQEYDAQCRREGVVDFAELLLRSVELLSANAALREHYQNRFQHLLVDEFQDTNRLQYQWLALLCGPHSALFAVGDDDQSIYAFRGAEVGNMRRLLQDYGVEAPIRLERNYRSSGTILDAANALIAHNQDRLGKNLWTDSGQGTPIQVYNALTDHAEAAFMVDEIRALVREGQSLSDCAILYRSNAQSRLIEHALFQAGIPYRVWGGLRFFERQEIKHALAYLRLVANPDDDNAFLRVVNVPARGIGARTIDTLSEKARHSGCSLWQAACTGGSGRSAASVGRFVLLIEALRAQAHQLPFVELISHVLDASGLRAMYEAEKEGGERLENLDELINAAVGFEVEMPDQPLEAFLAHAALEAGDHQANAGDNALQMMTIHAAKGLEFHNVFIGGLEEGLCPHENALNEKNGIEEERRLMYVAMTRARQRLYLSHAQSRLLHGQTRYPLRSRFIEEMPSGLLKLIGTPPQSNKIGYSINPFQPRKTALFDGWFLGQDVEHPRFGRGVIVDAESGSEARLQINFHEHGLKWLDLRYAKLNPC